MIVLKAINKPTGAEVTRGVYQTGAAAHSEVLDHCRGLSSFSLSHLAFKTSAMDQPETSAKIQEMERAQTQEEERPWPAWSF